MVILGENVPNKGMHSNKISQNNHMIYPPPTRLPYASGVAYCTPLTNVLLQRFSDGTIQKLQQTLVILEEVSNIRSLCNTTPQDQKKEEVIRLLILAPDHSNKIPNSKAPPLKPHPYPSSSTNSSPYLEAAKNGTNPPSSQDNLE